MEMENDTVRIPVARYGITGGIGSGKSFICKQLEAAGHTVFYCDDVAKRIIRTNPKVKAELRRIVGEEVYASDGTLCKSVLAEFLCRGNEFAERVNNVVHPLVAEAFLQQADGMGTPYNDMKQHRDEDAYNGRLTLNSDVLNITELTSLRPGSCIFMECALLFESGFNHLVERTILVHTDKETQISRVMQRDGVSRQKALEWIGLQLPECEKMRRADFIIHN